MKKLMCILILLLVPGAACCESWTVSEVNGMYYYVETFSGVWPEENIAQNTVFADDLVEQAVLLTATHVETEQQRIKTLLAIVQHDGKRLLIGGTADEQNVWKIWPAAETFLREGESYTLTAAEQSIKPGATIGILPCVAYEDGYYLIGYGDGYSVLQQYVNKDGCKINLTYPDGCYEWLEPTSEGTSMRREYYNICVPRYLAYLSADTFPRTEEELKAWSKAYPLTEGKTYVFAAHLREKPTGKSNSLGEYRFAPAEVLDEKPGTQFPWYQLRIGDTVGWMSGAYVVQSSENVNYSLAQALPMKIAQCTADTVLYTSPDGQEKQTLPAGVAGHIIAQCGDWYHIVLPQAELSWQTDQEGTYGYLRTGDVKVYSTLLNMAYGIEQ